MNLADLARKAAELPAGDSFEWAGPEQFHSENFNMATATHEDLVRYVDRLRLRMGEYARALHELQKAYRKMRDVMLEAEVNS